MERIKNTSMKQGYFFLTLGCLLLSVLLALSLWAALGAVISRYPTGGITFSQEGVITQLEEPPAEQMQIVRILDGVRIGVWILFPSAGLGIAGVLFYRWKLKRPIALLLDGTERIARRDLEFSIPKVSEDELGQVCAAFETMRAELLNANQELWRQAEERKRLNAAFAHDLRNPVAVLKGTVQMLRRGVPDPQALNRLETYTLRIEQYVEAMSSIQRLEQLPVQKSEIPLSTLRSELQETARLLAPALETAVVCPECGSAALDHGILLTVAENLISNAARFAKRTIRIELSLSGGFAVLTVADDGPGFPEELMRDGPRPFGTLDETAAHFGMGLYSSSLLCTKHGGGLCLGSDHGAVASASFRLF